MRKGFSKLFVFFFSLCLNSFVSTNAEFVLVVSKECSINKNAESHWNVWKSFSGPKRHEKKVLAVILFRERTLRAVGWSVSRIRRKYISS